MGKNEPFENIEDKEFVLFFFLVSAVKTDEEHIEGDGGE